MSAVCMLNRRMKEILYSLWFNLSLKATSHGVIGESNHFDRVRRAWQPQRGKKVWNPVDMLIGFAHTYVLCYTRALSSDSSQRVQLIKI